MSGCSGKCGSCSSGDKIDKIGTNEAPVRKHIGKERSDDFFYVLHPRKEKPMTKFDLDDKCPHYEFGTIKCSGCEVCISNWVYSHTNEEAEEKIEYLLKTNRAVAARRVQLAIEEKQKRR